MIDRFLLKLVLPLIAISLMLLGLGAIAAWNVQRQQTINSGLIAREVEGMLAAQAVDVGMRELRYQFTQYLHTRDERYFARILELREETRGQLATAQRLATTETQEEQELIGVVASGYELFWRDFDRIRAKDYEGDPEEGLGQLIDTTLSKRILVPGHRYVEYSRKVMERTNEASRATSDQLRQGFLLLGVCGGAAGLVAGIGLARGISRSIVQLDVSVRSAAGELNQVAGPVRISRIGGLREIEAGLNTMKDHIAEVVQRLQRSEREVLRNEQLAAVGQLAAGVAHELRNPLMPMKTLVQAALERDDGRGLCGRQLEVVDEEISRLEGSIRTFLEFARPAPLEKSVFDLGELVEQTLELVAGRAEQQGVVIRDSLAAQSVSIEADSGQIRQVLLNLVLNALDALPEGGAIFVSLESPPAGRPAEGEDPAWATLRVADSGTGLPADVLDRIFEPFVTSKETGTGLGLSICQRIITAHGGTIEAGNRAAGGAEFTIRLPVSAAGVDPAKSHARVE